MVHTIGLIGDYNPEVVAHGAIPQAIQLAADDLGFSVQCEWIPTLSLERDPERQLSRFQALWAVPASPYRSMEGALSGIRFAREQRIPLLGTCGGFQHMIIEFARNRMGIAEADHAEVNPSASFLLITPLTCSVSQQTLTIRLAPGSKAADIYERHEIVEQYGYCHYGLNPEFAPMAEHAGLRVAGADTDGEVRMMELEQHPFFIGTLFQPERSALKHIVHPLIKAFLRKAIQSS